MQWWPWGALGMGLNFQRAFPTSAALCRGSSPLPPRRQPIIRLGAVGSYRILMSDKGGMCVRWEQPCKGGEGALCPKVTVAHTHLYPIARARVGGGEWVSRR